MKISFNEEMYKLIKSVDLKAIEEYIVFVDSENSIEISDAKIVFKDIFDEEYQDTPINALLLCIDAEITKSGLSDDQNEVLPRGHQLYELYDSIYYFDEQYGG